MPLGERVTSVDRLRAWTDQIPFHYEYTAGVAGERFLRGLQGGKLLAGVCPKCGKSYLPPKMYCVDCFVEVKKFREVAGAGTVSAVTVSQFGMGGERLRAPRTFVFVTFAGVTGGLVQAASGNGLKVGSRVVPKFVPASKRTGSMLDFEFAKLSV